HGLASLVRGRSLPGSREAVLNERASPPEGRGREAEHPPEGPVEVRSVRKAGSVGGLGGRRTPCHLAQGVTQPQPEEVAADREPELRSEEMREPARRQRDGCRQAGAHQAAQGGLVEKL